MRRIAGAVDAIGLVHRPRLQNLEPKEEGRYGAGDIAITRQQAGRLRRAKNQPSARRGLAEGCCDRKFLELRDEEELGYVTLELKSEMGFLPVQRGCGSLRGIRQ